MAFAELVAQFVPLGVPLVMALFAAYHFREAIGFAAAAGTAIKALGAAVLVVWVLGALGIVQVTVDVDALLGLFGTVVGVVSSIAMEVSL